MDFIALEMGFRTGAKAKKLRSHAALDATYSLLRMQHRSHGQEAESLSGAWLSPILDAVGIFNGTAKHLKAAANADDWSTLFTEPAQFRCKTSTV